jgi:hypothetical protein
MLQNLTEALQLLLGRSLEEVRASSQTPEPGQEEPSKQVVSVEQWRPLEPAHVEKARLARRSGRYARYRTVRAVARTRHEAPGNCSTTEDGRTNST